MLIACRRAFVSEFRTRRSASFVWGLAPETTHGKMSSRWEIKFLATMKISIAKISLQMQIKLILKQIKSLSGQYHFILTNNYGLFHYFWFSIVSNRNFHCNQWSYQIFSGNLIILHIRVQENVFLRKCTLHPPSKQLPELQNWFGMTLCRSHLSPARTRVCVCVSSSRSSFLSHQRSTHHHKVITQMRLNSKCQQKRTPRGRGPFGLVVVIALWLIADETIGGPGWVRVSVPMRAL